MEANLLDRVLTTYCSNHTPVTIVLQNRGRVSGRIKAFDSYVIILETPRNEVVYRHAISSLLPSPDEQSQQPRERREQPKPDARPARYPQQAPQKSHPPRPAPRAAAAPEPGINNGMKEGLLRWMREQKAAK
jgi:host factor-I protein